MSYFIVALLIFVTYVLGTIYVWAAFKFHVDDCGFEITRRPGVTHYKRKDGWDDR